MITKKIPENAIISDYLILYKRSHFMMMKKGLIWLCAMALAASVNAEPNDSKPLNNKENKAGSELKDIQKDLFAVQKDLRQKQSQQKRTQQMIQQTKLALEKAQKELAELNRQQKITWEKWQELQNELTRLQIEVAGTKAQVARLLVNNYKNQQPSAIVLFLQNATAAQKSRFFEYSRYIQAANDKVLQQLADQQVQLEKQEKNIQVQLDKLKKLEAAARQKIAQLGKNHREAVLASNQLNQEIAKKSKQVSELRDDEKRLNAILAQIAQQRAAQRKAEALARQKEKNKQNQLAKSKKESNSSRGNLTAEDLATPKQALQSAPTRGFGALQGQMRRPVNGSIIGRFGQARETGGSWRGIFIATATAGVQSVAEGTVAYATHLRGYGNTVIIDHGDGYMTVYAGLSSIGVSSGSRVASRQSIGTTGTMPAGEQGLYFEVRYRGRNVNPSAWVR